MARTVFDIVRLTKKDNCGECGFPTCMAFAAAVTSGAAPLSGCPYVPEEALDGEVAGWGDGVAETALVKELRSKVKGRDFRRLALDLGGEPVRSGDAIELGFLGSRVEIGPEGAYIKGGGELDPRDQILLYNYLYFHGTGGLAGEWVGLESFPNSVSKVVSLKRYAEDKLASGFEGQPGLLVERGKKIGGREVQDCSADVCLEVPVLPMVPLRVLFWDRDVEDGFPSKVKVLFDSSAMEYLDLESLVFAAERLAETLVEG